MMERLSEQRLRDLATGQNTSSLAENAAMARELLAYREAWRKYGKRHHGDCIFGVPNARDLMPVELMDCTCGFDSLPEFLKGESCTD